MTTALEEGEWSATRPGRTLPPGKTRYPFYRRLGGPSGPVWTGGKSRPHRDSIPDRPVRSSVAIPTELPGPHNLQYCNNLLKSVFSKSLEILRVRNISNFVMLFNRLHVVSQVCKITFNFYPPFRYWNFVNTFRYEGWIFLRIYNMLHIRFMAFIQFLFCWMQLIMFFQFPYIGWGKKKIKTTRNTNTGLNCSHSPALRVQ